MDKTAKYLLIALGAFVALSFVGIAFIIFGIIISRLFVKPLKKVKESFEKINYGYVDFDKKIDSYTEMEDMFDSVNESFY